MVKVPKWLRSFLFYFQLFLVVFIGPVLLNWAFIYFGDLPAWMAVGVSFLIPLLVVYRITGVKRNEIRRYLVELLAALFAVGFLFLVDHYTSQITDLLVRPAVSLVPAMYAWFTIYVARAVWSLLVSTFWYPTKWIFVKLSK